MKKKDFEKKLKTLLKTELKKRDISYKDLAKRLESVGVDESDKNIANKLSRGKFSAVFLLQCLHVIGCNRLELDNGEDLRDQTVRQGAQEPEVAG
jgi:3-mercaptopyruvate sulfurtransferase SseA